MFYFSPYIDTKVQKGKKKEGVDDIPNRQQTVIDIIYTYYKRIYTYNINLQVHAKSDIYSSLFTNFCFEYKTHFWKIHISRLNFNYFYKN